MQNPQYWSAIWAAISLVYCFFLMEETNYDRPAQSAELGVEENSAKLADGPPHSDGEAQEKQAAPDAKSAGASDASEARDVEVGQVYKKKSYWQKLSLWPESRPNRLLPVMWGPIRFFSYPVVVYAGLMYGANGLTWSSILNATAGTLYPEKYGFSTAGIALAYLGGTVGVVVG